MMKRLIEAKVLFAKLVRNHIDVLCLTISLALLVCVSRCIGVVNDQHHKNNSILQ